MTTYRTSDGERVSKAQIDRNIRIAKEAKLAIQDAEYGYHFCEECQRSTGVRLDCSHIESVKTSQDNGRSEKAWDTDNIRILCRLCHQKHDKTSLG